MARTLQDRFWAKVRPETGDGCWEWTGSKNKQGYGHIWSVDRMLRATAVSWEMHYGQIPQEKPDVLHKCDNPSCVRPDHLFLGDDVVNARDREAKRRGGGHKIRGALNKSAKLSEADIAAIRERRDAGEICRTIASDYGVSISHVSHIGLRRNWMYLDAV